jgi:epoxyqueuosine reductase
MNQIEELIQFSKKLGFLDVGISLPSVSESNVKSLKNNIKNSFNAEMKWLERNPESRIDAGFLLKNASLVICFIHPVPIGKSRHPLRARFAMGDDYHKVLKEKLNIIVKEFLERKYPNVKTKICVDTSPIFEKAFAVSAGLGWIGKHTLLIHPKLGSNFVLGEIITDIKFTTSNRQQVINGCGDCQKCMDACPTKAIVKPYVLDARRCISYLTIENKKEIPEEFKQLCKDKYGCDVCVNVCPKNKSC